MVVLSRRRSVVGLFGAVAVTVAGVVPGAAVAVAPVATGAGVTSRISVADGGGQANRGSYDPAISANGRYVAFVSKATNIAPGVTNDGYADIVVRDRLNQSTVLVSVPSSGLSANRRSSMPSISSDGCFVAFVSRASNLVPGDTGHRQAAFVRDLSTGVTERVGADSPYDVSEATISGDGRHVLTNVSRKGLLVHDRAAGTTELVVHAAQSSAISEHGRFVAFTSYLPLAPNDTDHRQQDVYLRDRRDHTTRLASVNHPGKGGTGSGVAISGNGRYLAYEAPFPRNNSQWQIVVRDMWTARTRAASVNSRGVLGDNSSGSPVISHDGHYIVFVSYAQNLVPHTGESGYQLYGRNMRTGVTRLISASRSGGLANNIGWYTDTALSASGRYIAFSSDATNLVHSDTNDAADIFLRDRGSFDGPQGRAGRVRVAAASLPPARG